MAACNARGTPAQPAEERLAAGEPVLVEVDLTGARNIVARLPEATTVFIAPPSWDVLVQRRPVAAPRPLEAVERRLTTARTEMDAVDGFEARPGEHRSRPGGRTVGIPYWSDPDRPINRGRMREHQTDFELTAVGCARVRHPLGITKPAHRRAARTRLLQVRTGDLRGQAGTPDQRLLQPARRRHPRIRWPLVEPASRRPLSIAMREIHSDLLEAHRRRIDHRFRPQQVLTQRFGYSMTASPGRRRVPCGCGRRHRRIQGVFGHPALHRSRRRRACRADAGGPQLRGPPPSEALSGNPVRTDVFEDVDQVAHVKLGQEAEPGDHRARDRRPDGPCGRRSRR